ncbi:MAG TPA: AAA family ATPase [Gemmatimonadota bacterium]|nr:AAA family ATPase [Gemmatimonadota bacterium]
MTAHPRLEPSAEADLETAERLREARRAIDAAVGRTIIGQETVRELLLVTLLSRGHALLVGVPGLAKTLLVHTMADALDCSFQRIQFTPDLMPSDITGTEVIEEDPETGRRRLRFLPGPVFAHVLLADEINRTPPKTQAALLQAMQEREVTAGGETRPLEEPFFVLATQNPIEQEGTYPLPEAQLDRFMFELAVEYPERSEEIAIVRATTGEEPAEIRPVVSRSEVLAFQDLVRRVPVADEVVALAVDLARRSRPDHPQAPEAVRRYVAWGAGPRAGQNLVLGAKARALLQGRAAPDEADVRTLAPAVLRHRIVPSYEAEAARVGVEEIVRALVDAVDRERG